MTFAILLITLFDSLPILPLHTYTHDAILTPSNTYLSILVPLHGQRLPRRSLRRQIHGRTHRQPERQRGHRDRGELRHHVRRAERQVIPSLD